MRSERGCIIQQVASGHRVTIDFSFGHRITDDFKVWSQGHGRFWPVTYSRYRHNTLDLHVLENVRSSLALYLPPFITVTAKYLSFVGSTMHGGQGWPAMPLVSCQHEAMAAPTCARAGSQLGTDHAPSI